MTEGSPSTDARELNARFGTSGAVQFKEQLGGCVVHLNASGNTAVVAMQGAQVLSFCHHALGEVLWLSPIARLGTGKAVRGGIPICWPWFGPHPEGISAAPAHGFVRAQPWSVEEARGDEHEAHIILSFEVDPEVIGAIWPHATKLKLCVRLAETLQMSLTTENAGATSTGAMNTGAMNTGATSFNLTQALHTYLRVQAIEDVRVNGLEDRDYIDQLQHGSVHRSADPIVITGETDRIYQNTTDTVSVHDHAGGRIIKIAKGGSHSTVVWNPWIEKSARLGDMGEEGYRHMLCVETANAGRDVVTLHTGERHTLSLELSARATHIRDKAGAL